MMSMIHTHTVFILCACACSNRVVTIFKNQQTSFRDQTNDQEQCLSASVRKKKTKIDVQMLEHSSHKEDTVICD